MFKKPIIAVLFLFVILSSVYTAGWYYFAGIIDREISTFIKRQQMAGTEFDSVFSPAHGFPGVYKIVYSGDIRTPSGNLKIPKLEISGIPLEGQEITAIAPLGLSIEARNIPDDLKKIDQAAMTFIIPTKMPPEFSYPYLKIWHAEGNAHIEIPSLTLQWTDAGIFAETKLWLNQDLQPEGEATLGVSNHNFFVSILAEEMRLSNSKKLMLLTFLNALDNTNGSIVLPFRLDNNAFYLNMIRLGALPFIHWPGASFSGRERPDSPPVPHQ